MGDNLWFYRWLARLGWPRSYLGKVVLVTFLAMSVPLLSLIGYIVLAPADVSNLVVLALVLLATLAGTLLAIWALRQLLEPVLLAARVLKTYFDDGQVLQVPMLSINEAGLLLGNVAYAVQTFEQRRLALEQLASEDFLTGLLNRRAAEERLRQSLSLAMRNRLPLCIALMDIDQFKQINDQYGHVVGDQVLVTLSQRLKQILRGSDWAARWGGEEFLIVLFSEIEGTRTALERIRTDLAQLQVANDGAAISFTLSIGFTMVHRNDHLQTSVKRADEAMYQAKRAGRNRVHFYQGTDS